MINNLKHSIWSLIFSILCCLPGFIGLAFEGHLEWAASLFWKEAILRGRVQES